MYGGEKRTPIAIPAPSVARYDEHPHHAPPGLRRGRIPERRAAADTERGSGLPIDLRPVPRRQHPRRRQAFRPRGRRRIKPATARENITQIMWPSALHPELLDLPLHARALAVARELVGEDMVLDFDMLIDKAPHTGVPTPWHQDAGYWVDLPDKRAVSIWVALDEATLDNGCMWYVYGSHLTPLRPHWPPAAAKGRSSVHAPRTNPVPPTCRLRRARQPPTPPHPALLTRQHHRQPPPRLHPQLPLASHDPTRTRARYGSRPHQQRTARPQPSCLASRCGSMILL